MEMGTFVQPTHKPINYFTNWIQWHWLPIHHTMPTNSFVYALCVYILLVDIFVVVVVNSVVFSHLKLCQNWISNIPITFLHCWSPTKRHNKTRTHTQYSTQMYYCTNKSTTHRIAMYIFTQFDPQKTKRWGEKTERKKIQSSARNDAEFQMDDDVFCVCAYVRCVPQICQL